jgi:GNAT superfamily N-acetyltransferase
MTRSSNSTAPGLVPGIIRRLGPHDTDGFAAHLLRLDADARAARFGGLVSDSALRDHALLALAGGAVVLGYVIDGVLRGVGELHDQPGSSPATGEAAFSVEAGWQGRGIGSKLMRRVLSAATARGIRRVVVVCQSSNRMMRRLAGHFDARLEIVGTETTGHLTTPAATPLRLLRVAVSDGFDLAAENVERQARLFLATLPDRAA